MINEEELKKFAKHYYVNKDQMHDLNHIDRLLRKARKLGINYDYSKPKLICGAFFHGILKNHENEIRKFLSNKTENLNFIEECIQITISSYKSSNPTSIEGQLLHDAHLIEGGKTFTITKSIITGTLRNQSIQETINMVKKSISGKYKCLLPEAISEYSEIEAFTSEFINHLKLNL